MNVDSLIAAISFLARNYFRSHRYLREVVLIIIFHIFFWGFLYGPTAEDAVWAVFGVFGLLLTLVTVSSVYFLEKGNSLYFVLAHQQGRLRFFLAKFILIFLIDMSWVTLFTLIYGLRFPGSAYFLLLIPRLFFMGFLIALAISILSLSFSYRPGLAWLLMILAVFGGILNKTALFPLTSLAEAHKLFSLILPPFLEIIYSAITLEFPFWRIAFLGVGLVQLVFYFYLNIRLIDRKDFV